MLKQNKNSTQPMGSAYDYQAVPSGVSQVRNLPNSSGLFNTAQEWVGGKSGHGSFPELPIVGYCPLSDWSRI